MKFSTYIFNNFSKVILRKDKLRKTALLFSFFTLCVFKAMCVGEAGTYFNIFVAPNNEIEGRDVALIVTALDNNTSFQIIDTNEDGDSDDSASGILKAGQSYILFLRENGVNDDAPHAGEGNSKQDGDHFIVKSNNLILVSSANIGEYQHNWLPATNKTSKGKKFFVYSNQIISSPNDINVMAFEDNTVVRVSKISTSPTLHSGYTNVNANRDSLLFQRTLSRGKDLIYYFSDGKDALKPGETYLVTSNKEVTVQYGALYGNEHDGGGYVPCENGTSAGATFYFTVPFQDSTQQEVRIISWDSNNNVVLERYQNGNWLTVKNFGTLSKNQTAEWVGRVNMETYATTFRVRGSSGKKISVVEENWIETGNMYTSDLAMMVSPDNGTSAGTNFLAYIPIPTNESSVFNSYTNSYSPARATHAIIFGNKNQTAHVTIKDAYTNGGTINRNITIAAGEYADVVLDSLQWVSIYNGTGTMNGGPQRPYLNIKSDKEVAVMVTNYNDNWMLHYGSSMAHGFEIEDDDHEEERDAQSGDTVKISSHVNCKNKRIVHAGFKQIIDDGLYTLNTRLIDSSANSFINGTILFDSIARKTVITYPVTDEFDTTHTYILETNVIPTCLYSNGNAISENDLLNVETFMYGTVDSTEEVAENAISIAFHISGKALFQLSDTVVNPMQNIQVAATQQAVSYSWNFGNGQIAATDTASVSYTTTGIYNVTLSVENVWGCSANSTQTVIVRDQTNGIKDATQNEIKIWSAANRVFIDFGNETNVDAEISIYNTLGQQIKFERHYKNAFYSEVLDTVEMGYIVVTVKNNNRLVNKKLLVS